MKILNFNVRKEKFNDYSLCIFMILFLCLDIQFPLFINNLIDTNVGYGMLILLGLSMFFYYKNPLVGLFALLVIFRILTNASSKTGRINIKKYVPSEKKKYTQMLKFNPEPYKFTQLEEEMVSNIENNYNTKEQNNENILPIFSSKLNSKYIGLELN